MRDASSALDRMIERTGAPVFGQAQTAIETASGDWILLLAGDPAARPEVADLAVILPELVKGRTGTLRFAVIDREAEDALAAQYDVLVRPALVFLRDGQVKGAVPRIKDWAFYEQMLAECLPVARSERRASA